MGTGKIPWSIKDIINTPPTDGLWDDGRNDVQQLGMSYEDLKKLWRIKSLKKYLEIREKKFTQNEPNSVCKFNES